MFELIPKTNINFTGQRKLAFGLSGLFILFGLAAFVAIMVGKANMGLDFSGGTMIQGNFEKPVTVAAVRQSLADAGNYAEAARAFDAFVQANPRSPLAPNALFGAALARAALGDRGQAASGLETFLKQNPQHPLAKDAEQALAALR